MTCFTEGVDSQETGTLEVDSEGEKPRREPKEQDIDLSDQSLKETEVVLKKQGKPDYSLPKAYKIITLLNCLRKVAEKIMATRLPYLSQVSELLDID